MIPLYPIVPNPYILPRKRPPDSSWFSLSDLKDAFSFIPLAPESQYLLHWSRTPHQCPSGADLPQGFISLHLLEQAIAQDLQDLTLEGGTFIHYIDDLLICSPTQSHTIIYTTQVLNFLAYWGYTVSKSKAQLVQQVSYFGIIFTPGRCSLLADYTQAIPHLQIPPTHKQLQAFLGLTRYCRVWVPNCGLIAQPLISSIKR